MSVSTLEPVALSQMRPGERGLIVALEPGEGGRLHKLLALGLVPGSELALQQRRPAFVVRVGRTQLAIDLHLASGVRVRVQR